MRLQWLVLLMWLVVLVGMAYFAVMSVLRFTHSAAFFFEDDKLAIAGTCVSAFSVFTQVLGLGTVAWGGLNARKHKLRWCVA